jgi:hypothetical protein
MHGPGKYDDEATLVRNRTGAAAVALIVIKGEKGSGFSVQMFASGGGQAEMLALASTMEDAARELRKDAKKGFQ